MVADTPARPQGAYSTGEHLLREMALFPNERPHTGSGRVTSGAPMTPQRGSNFKGSQQGALMEPQSW